MTRQYAEWVNNKDIQKWIRSARKLRGWTQTDLGDAMGVTKGNVSHWETGGHDPSFLQLLKIRDLTGMPLHDVTPATDWPLPKVPREKIVSLTPEQLEMLQAGILGLLAAVADSSHASGSDARQKRQRAA